MTTNAKDAVQAFLFALTFMTRIPVGSRLTQFDEKTAVRSVLYYPAVGLLIGLLLALASCFLSAVPVAVTAVLILIAWVALTGALHLDGLADCMDAYYAGHKISDPAQKKQRILTVMHDPTSGAVALVSLVLLLLVKYSALVSMHSVGQSILALLVAPVLGRTLVLVYMALVPYARTGAAAPAQSLANRSQLWCVSVTVITAVAVVVAITLSVLSALLLLAHMFGLLFYWQRLWYQQIGGYTGDCLGALVELTETLFLLALVILW